MDPIKQPIHEALETLFEQNPYKNQQIETRITNTLYQQAIQKEGKRMKRSFWILATATITIVCISIFSYSYYQELLDTQMMSSDISNLSDPQELVNAGDHILIGTIVKQIGTKSPSGIKEIQYEVTVTEQLKGKSKTLITINQQIPSDQIEKLDIGQTYLFVTRYYPAEDWYTTIPIYGELDLSKSESKTMYQTIKKLVSN